MSDATDPEVSQQRAALNDAVADTAKRTRELENAFNFARGAVFVVLALLSVGGIAIANGALNTRDLANANAARIVVVEQAQSSTASQLREASTEARSTHDAIVRMTTAMEALLSRVDGLAAELRARESSPRTTR